MKFETSVTIIIDADSDKIAKEKLNFYLKNPRHPNTFPGEFASSNINDYSFSEKNSDSNYSDISQDDNLNIWSIWKKDYGWASSENLDGIKPLKLTNKSTANERLLQYYGDNLNEYYIKKYNG